MKPQQEDLKMNLNLKNTTPVTTEDGEHVFQQGYIIRKVSKFIVGAEEDAILPIAVFFSPSTGKILESTLPIDLREEYKDFTF